MRPTLIALMALCVMIFASSMALQHARGADGYGTPAFQAKWNDGESRVTNFWGPLDIARDKQPEQYNNGTRIVKYWDKGRMELDANGTVTSGLLATELKTGRMQIGDATFEARTPARVNVAGDVNGTGPTYADLNTLPARVDNAGSGPFFYEYRNGTFAMGVNKDSFKLGTETTVYQSDAAGKLGQYVPRQFVDFIDHVGFGSVGYPISPVVLAQVPVAGVPTVVMIQAFERRVLTVAITGGPTAPLVEFGNIGQHYYQWRYASPAAAANLTSTPTLPALPTLPTAATPVAIITPTAVAPTSSAFIGPAAIGPPVGATPTITFTTLTSPIAQGASATANIQTTPYANCSIAAVYKGVRSTASGLADRFASGSGAVSWTWKVEVDAPAGTWPVVVTCTVDGKVGKNTTYVQVT